MIKRFSSLKGFILSCAVALALSPHTADAQFFDDAAPAPAPTFVFIVKNHELKNILELQNQMQLLRRVIEHETAVNQMVETSINIGLNDPQIPSPSMEVCKSLPANIPCAQSYEDLYQNYSVAKVETKPLIPPAASMVSNSDIPSLPAGALSELPGGEPAAVADTGPKTYWMDISCLGKKCSAIVSPDPKKADMLYRVYVGEKLTDGSLVKAISAAGVTVEQNSKEIKLEPAPA